MVENTKKRNIIIRINENEEREGTTFYVISVEDKDTGERWIQKER
jgi:hypothetical protein